MMNFLRLVVLLTDDAAVCDAAVVMTVAFSHSITLVLVVTLAEEAS